MCYADGVDLERIFSVMISHPAQTHFQSSQMDAQWFAQAQTIMVEPYKWLKADNHTQERDRFLAEESRNPRFTYDISEDVISERMQKLVSLKMEVMSFTPQTEEERVMKDMYRQFIASQSQKLQMLYSVARGDDVTFRMHSYGAYGALDREICAFSVRNVKLASLKDTIGWQREAYESLQRTFAQAREHLGEVVVHIPAITKLTETIEEKSTQSMPALLAEEVKRYFEEYLSERNLNAWTVCIDETGKQNSLNTSQEEKIVWIPCDERLKERAEPFTADKMHALAVHEVGVHALRRERGEQLPIALAGLGLTNYLESEEGLTTAWEQKILGAYPRYRSWVRYLAMAYACGNLTGEERDFRDTFEFLTFLLALENPSRSENWCRNQAWKHAWRIFRGSTGQTPGALFMKDQVYREGNIKVWKTVSKDGLSLDDSCLYAGKFDITNPQQWDWLRTIGAFQSS